MEINVFIIVNEFSRHIDELEEKFKESKVYDFLQKSTLIKMWDLVKQERDLLLELFDPMRELLLDVKPYTKQENEDRLILACNMEWGIKTVFDNVVQAQSEEGNGKFKLVKDTLTNSMLGMAGGLFAYLGLLKDVFSGYVDDFYEVAGRFRQYRFDEWKHTRAMCQKDYTIHTFLEKEEEN